MVVPSFRNRYDNGLRRVKKSNEAATARVFSLPLRLRPSRGDELEFLAAALEIIETPASPAGRAIASTIILFFVIAVTWACIGKADIIATASGRIIPSGRTKLIQPFKASVVRAIHVSDGQVVKAGEVLVELDSTANAADETRLEHDLLLDRLDVARLDALLAGDLDDFAPPKGADPLLVETARRQMQAQAAEQAAKLDALDRQIAEKQAEIQGSQATIAKIAAILPMLRGVRDIREELLHNMFGSKLLYLEAQQKVVEQERQRVLEQAHETELGAALTALQQQRVEIAADYRKTLLADLAKAENSASEHNQEAIKAADKRALQTLRAPVDGTVQQLAVHTIGGVVTPAQQLMVIVPATVHLEIEASLTNRDVGFVQAGQPVAVKVEAFTFTRYGLLHGTVLNVSRDVVAADVNGADARFMRNDDTKPSRRDQDQQSQQPAYVAHIALAETGIQTEQGWRTLDPGMAVTAEIKTGRRRVISYLLSPLLRYRQEALRER